MIHSSHHTVSSKEITDFAKHSLLNSIPEAKREQVSESIRLSILAATQKSSIHQVASNTMNSISGKTVRNKINGLCCDMRFVENIINQALHSQLPKKASKTKKRSVAIDFHTVPYHGNKNDEAAKKYIRRGPKKSGTKSFLTIATVCMLYKTKRYTIAFTMVSRREPIHKVVLRLFHIMRKVKFVPSLCLMDREFYVAKTMSYLKRKKIPFIVPAKKMKGKLWRTKELGLHETPKDLPEGWYTYVLNKQRGKKSNRKRVGVDLCVSKKPKKTKGGKIVLETIGFACWGLKGKRVRWIKETYKNRFGIESSYRQIRQARIRTTTKNPFVRAFYFGISLILRQCWVFLHFEVFALRRKGPRMIDLSVMSLDEMLICIRIELEEQFVWKKIYKCSKPLQGFL